MEISEVRITIRDEEVLKCFANVIFDNCFVVRGVKVIQLNKGYLVSMPSHKRPDGTHCDIAHPINAEMRRKLEEAVITAYTDEVKLNREQWTGSRAEARAEHKTEAAMWPGRLKKSG